MVNIKTKVKIVIELTEDEAAKLKAILGGMTDPKNVDALEDLYDELDNNGNVPESYECVGSMYIKRKERKE